MNFIKRISLIAAAAASLSAAAETVLLFEDFNDTRYYAKSFNYFYNADKLTPHSSIKSLFVSAELGENMAWWLLRDSSTSEDRFMSSHSYYTEPGTSNDWLISVPLDIPSGGFVLSFDAQSVPIRSADRLSDLAIYITETLLDPANIPDEETVLFESIPYGKDINNCENDWIHYTYPLDAYAGKTIYINFVNQNYDKDILCIDNVKVSREDMVTLVANPIDRYTTQSTVKAGATLTSLLDEGISDFTVKLTATTGNTTKEIKSWHSSLASNGSSEYFEADVELPEIGTETEICFTFETAAQKWATSVKNTVTRMAFNPVHRVLVEETTSLHCGNCPIAIYNLESMLEDGRFEGRMFPVSVHIANLGYDPMAVPEYYNHMFTAAPLALVDRRTRYEGSDNPYLGFIPAYDCDYNPDDENSFAFQVARIMNEPTTVDLNVSGEWVINASDTTAIKCRATVRPAFNLKDKNYRVAFILTENNVGLDNNAYWIQENYVGGATAYESHLGGWTDLPKQVVSARYHDVARFISNYNGHEGSLPANMNVSQDYTFDYTLTIPDTYEQVTTAGGTTYLKSDAIQRQFCNLTAIVIDASTGEVVNSARVPMSNVTENRFTASDLVGVEDVMIDSDAEIVGTEYYDLGGRRVESPSHGIYLRRDRLSDGSVRTSKTIK